MYIKRIIPKLALTLMIVLYGISTQAQRIWMPSIEVQEGDTIVDVPIYLTVTDSLTSLQLSILWDAEQLRLDTLIFAAHLRDIEDAMMTYNVLSEQEMRAIFINSRSSVDQDPFAPDSLLLTMRFHLTDKFTGAATIIFNPEFQTFFAHYDIYRVFPELEGGSISTPGNTTSLWPRANQTSVISLFPNPVNQTFNLLTEEPELKNTTYYLTDVMGRQVDHGVLINGQGEIPDNLPNGTYFLTLLAKEAQLTAKLVVKR